MQRKGYNERPSHKEMGGVERRGPRARIGREPFKEEAEVCEPMGREQGQQGGWADRPCEERRAEGFNERRPRIMREGRGRGFLKEMKAES
jgi:hypothetical protein